MAAKTDNKSSFRFFYEPSTRTVTCRWTCPLKMAKRMSSRYCTKQRQVEPLEGEAFKTAKARLERELQAEAEEELRRSQIEAEQWKLENNPDACNETKIYAAEYLRNLPEDKVCGSTKPKSRHYAKQYVISFADWIDDNLGDKLELHQIEQEHCKAWLRYLEQEKHYAFSTIDTMKAWVQACFELIEERFTKSHHVYRNPFRKIKMKKVGLENTVVPRRENFTIEQLEYILKRAGEGSNHSKNMKFHTFAFFYFLMVTGWREGVVAGLQWSDIDFSQNIITKIHNKTEDNTEQRTRLYITPLMRCILEKMRSLPAPKRWKNYVFCNGRDTTNNLIQSNVTKAQTHMRAMRKELSFTKTHKKGKYVTNPYTVHSIRGTLISLLKGAGNVSEDVVEYIVGHAGDSVSETNYERFDSNPELFTRDAIEFMEAMINAEIHFVSHTMPPALYKSRLDSELPYGWQKRLQVNFWEVKAIDVLDEYYHGLQKSGCRTAARQVNDFIDSVNEIRRNEGLSKVTADRVKVLLQLLATS